MSVVVTDTPPWVQYIATANQTVYVVPYLFFTQTDLNVYSRAQGAVVSDAADILTYNVDYTVSINAAPAVGGTITLNTPSNLNDIITIYRNQPDQRLNNYANGGPFEAPVVNPDFQQIVLMTQQNKFYDQTLCPHYNVNATTTPGVDNILPVLAPNTTWVKNANGTAIVAGTPSSAVVTPGVSGHFASFIDNAGTIGDSGIPIANVPRILSASIPMTAAQFKTLAATPFQLLPAPGNNKGYLVLSFYTIMNYGTTQYAGGGTILLGVGAGPAVVNGSIAKEFFYFNFSTLNQCSGLGVGGTNNAVPIASLNNGALRIYNSGPSEFTTGDSNFLINLSYQIIDLT